MAATILGWLTRRRISSTTVLDLGCGTGAATIAFARAGLRAIGLDQSPAMLHQAQRNAEQAGVRIELLTGDLTAPELDQRFDLVTAVYDTVNYIDDEHGFCMFIQSAYRLLNPGGVLVFDMNTRHRLMSSWEQGLMVAADSDDLFVTYRSWYDDRLDVSPLIVTGFERANDNEKDNRWIRFDEEHFERSWPIARVERWLEDTGFQAKDITGYVDSSGELIRPATEDHGRVVFFSLRDDGPETAKNAEKE